MIGSHWNTHSSLMAHYSKTGQSEWMWPKAVKTATVVEVAAVAADAEDIVNIIVEDTTMTGEVIADMTTAEVVVVTRTEVCFQFLQCELDL